MEKVKKATLIGATAALLLTGESFIGSKDWVDILDLPNESAIRKAAGAIGIGYQLDKGGVYTNRCNYWSVGHRLVLSNGHCLKDDKRTEGIKVHFTENRSKGISCEKLLAHSPWEGYDYILLECAEDIPAPVTLKIIDFTPQLPLLHISHNCDYYANSQCEVQPKYDMSQDCKVFDADFRGGIDFSQGCDSLSGSSGSPVHLRAKNEKGGYDVIGLHHASIPFPDERGSVQGFGIKNTSVKLIHVINDIRGKTGIDLLTINDKKVEAPKEGEETPVLEEPKEERISFWRALIILIKSYF